MGVFEKIMKACFTTPEGEVRLPGLESMGAAEGDTEAVDNPDSKDSGSDEESTSGTDASKKDPVTIREKNPKKKGKGKKTQNPGDSKAAQEPTDKNRESTKVKSDSGENTGTSKSSAKKTYKELLRIPEGEDATGETKAVRIFIVDDPNFNHYLLLDRSNFLAYLRAKGLENVNGWIGVAYLDEEGRIESVISIFDPTSEEVELMRQVAKEAGQQDNADGVEYPSNWKPRELPCLGGKEAVRPKRLDKVIKGRQKKLCAENNVRDAYQQMTKFYEEYDEIQEAIEKLKKDLEDAREGKGKGRFMTSKEYTDRIISLLANLENLHGKSKTVLDSAQNAKKLIKHSTLTDPEKEEYDLLYKDILEFSQIEEDLADKFFPKETFKRVDDPEGASVDQPETESEPQGSDEATGADEVDDPQTKGSESEKADEEKPTGESEPEPEPQSDAKGGDNQSEDDGLAAIRTYLKSLGFEVDNLSREELLALMIAQQNPEIQNPEDAKQVEETGRSGSEQVEAVSAEEFDENGFDAFVAGAAPTENGSGGTNTASVLKAIVGGVSPQEPGSNPTPEQPTAAPQTSDLDMSAFAATLSQTIGDSFLKAFQPVGEMMTKNAEQMQNYVQAQEETQRQQAELVAKKAEALQKAADQIQNVSEQTREVAKKFEGGIGNAVSEALSGASVTLDVPEEIYDGFADEVKKANEETSKDIQTTVEKSARDTREAVDANLSRYSKAIVEQCAASQKDQSEQIVERLQDIQELMISIVGRTADGPQSATEEKSDYDIAADRLLAVLGSEGLHALSQYSDDELRNIFSGLLPDAQT